MNTVNQKIIDAVIAKAARVCPDSLALIGIYGSAATGDVYEKSDLDRMILIDDSRGWALADGFLLEDSGVGYDIYCTDWDALRRDAQCTHAHLSKLLDSKIVCAKREGALQELEQLRDTARGILQSEARFSRVDDLIREAKTAYADAHLHDSIGAVRMDACRVVYSLLSALMLYHGAYFRLGVKRTMEELAQLPIDPDLPELLTEIAGSKETAQIRKLLTELLRYVENHTRRESPKQTPSRDLAGTYEEMHSNWRNKVEEAAHREDLFSAFMNLCSFQNMLDDLSAGFDIGEYPIMEAFDPDNLSENVSLYDRALKQYEAVYHTAGLNVKRYTDVDTFVQQYLK